VNGVVYGETTPRAEDLAIAFDEAARGALAPALRSRATNLLEKQPWLALK